ncbi:hypothetical protein IAU60_000608 [Kwoniella sp. DSM 27419]
MPVSYRQASPLPRPLTADRGPGDVQSHASSSYLSPQVVPPSAGPSPPPPAKQRTPVPFAALVPLMVQRVSEGLTYGIIFPYINQMVLDMGVEEKSVGVWSATAESAMMGAEAMAAPFYGPLADRLGRRPVMIVLMLLWGVFGVAFGFTRTVWGVIFTRGALGLLAGCGVVSRTMVGELCDKSNRIQGFALFSPSLVVGLTLAPVLGGFLANPVPRLLSPSWTLFDVHPYLLPALLTGASAIIAGILSIMLLPETLKRTKNTLRDAEKTSDGGLRGLLRYTPFQNVLLLYGMQNAVQYSWEALYPLYGFTSKSLGGLGLSTSTLGVVLGLSAGLSILMTIFVFPVLHSSTSESTCLKLCLIAYPLAMLFFPVIWAISYSYEGDNLPLSSWLVIGMQMFLRRVGDFAATQLDTLVLDFIPGPEHLASANAITFSVAAIGRCLGPFIISYFFSLSTHFTSPFSPGRQLVWFIFILMSLPSVVLAHRLLSDGSGEKEAPGMEEERYELIGHDRTLDHGQYQPRESSYEGYANGRRHDRRGSSSIEVHSEEAVRYRAGQL